MMKSNKLNKLELICIEGGSPSRGLIRAIKKILDWMKKPTPPYDGVDFMKG